MSSEVDSLNMKLQDAVKFIESNNTKASEVEEKLKVITTWMCEQQRLRPPISWRASTSASEN